MEYFTGFKIPFTIKTIKQKKCSQKNFEAPHYIIKPINSSDMLINETKNKIGLRIQIKVNIARSSTKIENLFITY